MKIDGGKKERSEANRTETTPAEENVNIKRKQQHRGKKTLPDGFPPLPLLLQKRSLLRNKRIQFTLFLFFFSLSLKGIMSRRIRGRISPSVRPHVRASTFHRIKKASDVALGEPQKGLEAFLRGMEAR